MTETIIIPELPPMLNGSNGLKRMHWATYTKIRDKWTWLVRQQTKTRYLTPVHITFVRHSSQQPDWDNLYASFKVIGDAMKAAGVLKDDTMQEIVTLTAKWEKSKQKEQKTEIIITSIVS
jgi:Holliday junction resolvase RusA-like endonuclease